MGTSKILIDGVGIDLTADTVAANKMLSGTKAHDSNGDSVTGNIQTWAGQQKSGTKNIAANGTFDVSEFASVAVNVPTANAATFEFTLATNKSGTSFAVVASDERVAEHYADDNALVSIQKIDGEKAYHWIEYLIQGNRNLTLGSSSPFYGGAGHNSTSADNFDLTNQALSSPITGVPTVRAMATADGDIILYCNTARFFGAGTYKIVFSW